MSKKSYIAGFCKAASAMNVNPEALAHYAMSKAADGKGGVMSSINDALGSALNWWNDPGNAAWRPLIGAGVGSALGTGIGAAVKGKKGLKNGAILGAIGGGLASVNWRQLSEALGKLGDKARQKVVAAKRRKVMDLPPAEREQALVNHLMDVEGKSYDEAVAEAYDYANPKGSHYQADPQTQAWLDKDYQEQQERYAFNVENREYAEQVSKGKAMGLGDAAAQNYARIMMEASGGGDDEFARQLAKRQAGEH